MNLLPHRDQLLPLELKLRAQLHERAKQYPPDPLATESKSVLISAQTKNGRIFKLPPLNSETPPEQYYDLAGRILDELGLPQGASELSSGPSPGSPPASSPPATASTSKADTKPSETPKTDTSKPKSTGRSKRKNGKKKRNAAKQKSQPFDLPSPPPESLGWSYHWPRDQPNPRMVQRSDKAVYRVIAGIGTQIFDLEVCGVTCGQDPTGRCYMTFDMADTEMPPRDPCHMCLRTEKEAGRKFKWCGGCWAVRYCGKACQILDRKWHRKHCNDELEPSKAEIDHATIRMLDSCVRIMITGDGEMRKPLHEKRPSLRHFAGWIGRCAGEAYGLKHANDAFDTLKERVRKDGWELVKICMRDDCENILCLSNRDMITKYRMIRPMLPVNNRVEEA